MDPDRWRQIKELCHEARARAEGERAAFLAEACAGDEALRQEVESLLNQPEHTRHVSIHRRRPGGGAAPNGEPTPLTHDNLIKMSPLFSPDGSRIAYTVREGNAWDTWVVPALRGEPRRWRGNASGLTWAGPTTHHFSQIPIPSLKKQAGAGLYRPHTPVSI